MPLLIKKQQLNSKCKKFKINQITRMKRSNILEVMEVVAYHRVRNMRRVHNELINTTDNNRLLISM